MGYGRRRAAVSLLTLGCGVSAGLDVQQAIEYTNNFQYLRGQSVQPVFDGWSKLPDGGFTMHFGYLNRSWVERPIIPVGPTNQVTPAVRSCLVATEGWAHSDDSDLHQARQVRAARHRGRRSTLEGRQRDGRRGGLDGESAVTIIARRIAFPPTPTTYKRGCERRPQ